MPSARPSATATMTTSSRSEPAGRTSRLWLRHALVVGRRPARPRRRPGRLGARRRLVGLGGGAAARRRGLGSASALAAASARRRRPPRPRSPAAPPASSTTSSRRRRRASAATASASPPRRPRLGRLMEQPGLDGLLGPDVAALADAGALADALAQVVELRAPDVAAGGDSIFSIFGECTGNVRSTPTPKDCLRTVNVSRAPWPWRLMTTPSKTWVRRRVPSMTWKWTRTRSPACEVRDAAQLGALEAVDDGAHGEGGRSACDGRRGCSGRRARAGSMVAKRRGARAPPRSRLRARRHWRISSWWPESRTSGTPPAAVLGRARVVRVLGVAAQRGAEGLLDRPSRRGRARPGSLRSTASQTTIAASSPPREHVAADRDARRWRSAATMRSSKPS